MKTLNNVISKNILKQSINNLYNDGLPFGLTTDVQNLDNIFRIDRGKLVTITGIPNMGKSEFLDFLCTQYNKIHGLKTVYFSPENQPLELHMSKLISKYTNTSFSKDCINVNEYNKVVDYVTDNYYFLNYENVFDLDVVLNETEQLINNENIGILVVDSYNKLEAQKDFSVSETDYISKVLDKLERFAKKMNIIVFLVAHPRKMQKDGAGNYIIPSPYDINGSANFFNKSDYCLTVHRDYINNNTIIKVDKVKFKNYGAVGECTLGYDCNSGNYFGIDDSISDFETGLPDRHFEPYNFVIPEVNYSSNNTNNLLDTEINYFASIGDTTPKQCTLNDVLLFTDKFIEQKIKVDRVRKEYNKKEFDKERATIQKSCLMNYTVSCTFDEKRDSKNIKNINNLICVDIDKQDNLQIINKVPDILKNLDNVLYMSKSCSGKGYFCLIPIADTTRFSEHWNSLSNDFAKMGITVDKACKDVTRVRYFSYDDDYYYNQNAVVYSRFESLNKSNDRTEQREQKKTTKATKRDVNVKSNPNYKKVLDIIKDCKEKDIQLTDEYADWFNIAMSLISEFGENGKDLFNQISELSNKYDKDECDEKYEEWADKYEESNDININTLFFKYKELKQSVN